MKRTKAMNYNRFRKVRSFWKYSALFIAVSSAFFLTACDDSKEVSVYKTIDDCEIHASTPEAKNHCALDYQNALRDQEKVSPKYNTKQDCEDEFGTDRCQSTTQTTSSGSHMMFFPLMSGYTSSSANYPSQPLYSSSRYASPMYNKFVDAKGNSFGSYSSGRTVVPSSSLAAKAPTTTTVTRGGFGSTVSRVSSMSHSSSAHSMGG